MSEAIYFDCFSGAAGDMLVGALRAKMQKERPK